MSERGERLAGAGSPGVRPAALLATVGAATMLAQYIAVREISSTLFSTELSVSFAVLATLVGPAAGYALAERVPRRALVVWSALAVGLHLAAPVLPRALVALAAGHPVALVFTAAALFSSTAALAAFYATFLPRLAGAASDLPARYAVELLGAALALALLAVAPTQRTLLAGYALLPAAVVALAFGPRVALPALALGALAWTAYPTLDAAAARAFYARRHHHIAPAIVETVYSPYQRIDVVDDARGRSLYLDGVAFYRAGDLASFDVLLAGVPGALRPGPRGNALVLGSGSFSSAAQLRRAGYRVTVAELDESVARVGFRDFSAVHGLRAGDVTVLARDGRRVIADARPGTYDVIVLDVPAPYHLRTAVLHTSAFYSLVRSRLAPGGVAALSLCDDADGPVGRAIAGAAAQAFPSVLTVESDAVGLAVLYAGDAIPFDAGAVASQLAALGVEGGGAVLPDADVRALVAGGRAPAGGAFGAALELSRMAWRDAFGGR